MSLIVSCSNCEKKYKVGDDKAGKKIKCAGCGTIISIPGAAAPEPQVEEEDPWDAGPSHSDEAEDDFELPPPRRSAPRRPAARSRSSRSSEGMPGWLKVLLIVFGSIGGITVLGCGGCILVGRITGEALKKAATSGSSRSAGTPAGAVWTKYTDPERTFEIEFPAANVIIDPSPEGKQYHTTIPGMDTDFRVGAAPTGVAQPTVEQQRAALNTVRDELLKQQNASLVSSKEVTIAQQMGMEAEYKVIAEGKPMELTCRFVYIKDRYYQFLVARHQGANLRAETERFFNSFRVLK